MINTAPFPFPRNGGKLWASDYITFLLQRSKIFVAPGFNLGKKSEKGSRPRERNLKEKIAFRTE